MKYVKLFFSIIVILLLSGCLSVPIYNAIWETDSDGFTRYFTNDPERLNRTFWLLVGNINEENTFQIESKKMSGAANMGFGMVFGAPSASNSTFYLLTIATTGSYRIAKRLNNEVITIRDWSRTEFLYTGFNTINTLKVIKAETTYTVFLNGNQVYQFVDANISGNRLGFWVSIGRADVESFPGVPVDVRFRQVR